MRYNRVFLVSGMYCRGRHGYAYPVLRVEAEFGLQLTTLANAYTNGKPWIVLVGAFTAMAAWPIGAVLQATTDALLLPPTQTWKKGFVTSPYANIVFLKIQLMCNKVCDVATLKTGISCN